MSRKCYQSHDPSRLFSQQTKEKSLGLCLRVWRGGEGNVWDKKKEGVRGRNRGNWKEGL